MVEKRYYKDRFCRCGCGGRIQVQSHHKSQGIPRYINHHYSKSKEGREQKSYATKNRIGGYSGVWAKKSANHIKSYKRGKHYGKKLGAAMKGNKRMDLLKMKAGFQRWKKENPDLHRAHQKEAGIKGGIATTILQHKRGFISEPEKRVKSILPEDFRHNKKFGRFFPDFRSERRKIIIEVDGVRWHSMPHRIISDRKRENFFRSEGYMVIHITDIQVMSDLMAVKRDLRGYISDIK